MSYVLGMSFEYHRYHRDAIIKVYADDRLVDEFSLTKDIKLKTIDCTDMPPGPVKFGPQNYRNIIILPEKLFLFKISERYLHDRIRIEVENSYNNHTNGFMTEYAYIDFRYLFLVPDCMLHYKNWKLLGRFDIDHAPAGKGKDRNWLLEHGFNGDFPTALPPGEIIEKSADPSENFGLGYKKGGSFAIEIPTTKKHKIIHFGRFKPGKIQTNRKIQRVLWSFNALNMGT